MRTVSQKRVHRKLPMRGLSQSTHICYKSSFSAIWDTVLVLRGADLSTTKCDVNVDDGPSLPTPICAHTDEAMHPSIIVGHNLGISKVVTSAASLDNHRVKMPTPLWLKRDERMIELHGDSMLFTDGERLKLKELDMQQSEIIEVSSWDVRGHNRRMRGNPLKKSLMLPLSSKCKLLLLHDGTINLTDFRGSTQTITASSGYSLAAKANCKAYFWKTTEEMSCLDRGVLHERGVMSLKNSSATEFRAKRCWKQADDFLPYGFSSVHALSNISSIVAMSCEGFNTKIYDVKREQLLAYTAGESWTDTAPIFIAGFPQFIGINSETSLLEVIA